MSTPAFQQALAQVLKWEGGFSNHAADPGGATNYGITQRTYDQWRDSHQMPRRSVKEITRSEVSAIYHRDYWLKAGCDQLDDPALALVVFDAAVNSGVGRALGWLAVTRDWRLYNVLRLQFLAGLDTWQHFGRGWVRRVADLTAEAARVDQERREDTSGRMLLVYGLDGEEAARVGLGERDVLVRITRDRVHVRPDEP